MSLDEIVEERLRAFIYPNTPRTRAQTEAFELAVETQLKYEKQNDGESIPENVASFSIGDYSVALREGTTPDYSRADLAPGVWALLFNAKLLMHSMPVARRL